MHNIPVFDFDKAIVLEDERVLLRPLAANDFDFLLPFSLNEPELWKHSPIGAAGYEGLKKYIDIALLSKQSKQAYPFIIWDKATQKYVGSTRYYDVKIINKSLLLGFTWYGSAFQATGINKHCKFLLLEYAFENMNMERVEFRADNTNLRSVAAMESIGCVKEGVLRSELLLPSGRRRDTVVLSILKDEWILSVKDKLKAKLFI
ncbi:GNAT family N-acetyltransferase [Flavobacterium sp. NKUCC04_CG]|nr:GNAT family protein [Flavobacterium sp. NKUCC04_CG]MBW3519470.1 GNAT family N-acetyltransferase [Flavobacterium sp. NKUCC04_CG]